MDLSGLSVTEIIQLYSQSIKELKLRHVLRTNNVIGDLGEYLVLDCYSHSPELPTLNQVPIGTQNINAFGQDGKRYAIKSTSGHVTGVFYGLEPPGSKIPDTPIFEYVIICKFDDNFMMQAIYQIDWNTFLKHKRWHSRMKAWNLAITQNLIADAKVVFDRNNLVSNNTDLSSQTEVDIDDQAESDIEDFSIDKTIFWEKSKGIKHAEVKEKVAHLLEQRHGMVLKKLSDARYESDDKMTAVFVMSASYSEKNKEYWYSIADENLPWLRNYPYSYVAFALGSSENTLEFSLKEFELMLQGCLHTEEDPAKKKTAHFHISFSPEGNRSVFFKKKKPVRDFIDVSSALI